jgi:hypothetical protein
MNVPHFASQKYVFEHDLFRKPVATFRDHAPGGLVGRIQPFYELWRKLARASDLHNLCSVHADFAQALRPRLP